MKDVQLIINVRSGQVEAALATIEKSCLANQLHLTHIYEVKNSQDIIQAVQESANSSLKTLIVAGGDGTVSSVINKLAGKPIQFAVVPLGTTNNFARSLAIPFEIEQAIGLIGRGRIKSVDLGKMNDEYFSNVAGIGLSARIAKSVTTTQKKRYGRVAYGLACVKVLLNHKPFIATITDAKNNLQVHFETHQLIVANGKFHAGREIASDAKLDSRELVIVKLGGRTRLSMIISMFQFYFGGHRSVKHSSYITGKNLSIKTSVLQPIELDGETGYSTPVSFQIAPSTTDVYSGSR